MGSRRGYRRDSAWNRWLCCARVVDPGPTVGIGTSHVLSPTQSGSCLRSERLAPLRRTSRFRGEGGKVRNRAHPRRCRTPRRRSLCYAICRPSALWIAGRGLCPGEPPESRLDGGEGNEGGQGFGKVFEVFGQRRLRQPSRGRWMNCCPGASSPHHPGSFMAFLRGQNRGQNAFLSSPIMAESLVFF